MEPLFIPTENDFRKWIKDAIKECWNEFQPKTGALPAGEEPLLSRKEIANKFHISLVTLNDWVKHGFPSHKQGGRVYFLYSEVLEYIRQTQPRKLFH